MGLRFEWDEDKARRNIEKHGASFDEGTTVFGDPLSLTIEDPLHSWDEERFITIGESAERSTLVVVHTDRGGAIRIISVREATGNERRTYEQG